MKCSVFVLFFGRIISVIEIGLFHFQNLLIFRNLIQVPIPKVIAISWNITLLNGNVIHRTKKEQKKMKDIAKRDEIHELQIFLPFLFIKWQKKRNFSFLLLLLKYLILPSLVFWRKKVTFNSIRGWCCQIETISSDVREKGQFKKSQL